LDMVSAAVRSVSSRSKASRFGPAVAGLKSGESLEAGTVEAPARTQGTPRGLAWTRFLAERSGLTPTACALPEAGFGRRGQLIDTKPLRRYRRTYRESFNDFVDMHAYWQHPSFPGRPWDGANWTIRNTPMAADRSGGNLTGWYLSGGGQAFTVSEYDHPAPSHYAAEMFPMIASFAALQDWTDCSSSTGAAPISRRAASRATSRSNSIRPGWPSCRRRR